MIDDVELSRNPQHFSVPDLDLDRLEILSALGRGAKGVVFLARDEVNGEILALKVISRDSIENKSNKAVKTNPSYGNEYRRVSFEQQVLRKLNHPLLPRLRGVLATDKVVGYAIDYCPGRDLNSLRRKQTEKMFSDDVIRFYAAELVLALEYLHNLGIVYRDLKPENIMIQENGHVMLVDFDLSTELAPISPIISSTPLNSVARRPADSVKKKRFSPFHWYCSAGISPDFSASQASVNSEHTDSNSVEKSNSFVGTEEYVAPEIISGNGHDFAVDWWSLGVVLHEMLYGTTPFRGLNRKETFYRILTKSPDLVGEPTSLRNLIRKLLEKDQKQRITVEGIKGHEFFRGIDWESILRIERPPFIPAESEEGTEVNNRIDVEVFVQEIFANSGCDGETEKKSNLENVDKDGWVKTQNRGPLEANQFSVF